jgi:8-hydroxy-5-deazaflavin:NADPH oxidoreductase
MPMASPAPSSTARSPASRWNVLVASDDEDAKRTVGQLVEDGGLRAVDAGPLARARELEALGYLHMAPQRPLGTGFSTTIKVLA